MGYITSKKLFSICPWVINVITTVIPPVRAGIAGALIFILTSLWLVTHR
jgi:hypothetical protein